VDQQSTQELFRHRSQNSGRSAPQSAARTGPDGRRIESIGSRAGHCLDAGIIGDRWVKIATMPGHSKIRSTSIRIAIGAGAVALVLMPGWILPVRHWTITLADRIRGAGMTGVLIFVTVYVVAEVALMPGSLLTMAAGFAYGPVGGLLVASPASVLAATAAFLLGRTVLRGWIQKRLARSPKTRALDRAIGTNSFKLILLLRLSPLIPFNLLNYILGLSDVPLRRYVTASFIGMLPGTWLYVYLGSLATTAAGLTNASREGGVQRIVLTVAGLVATVLAILFITRAAKRALVEELRR
jgi:uncharacterized membrane protein YdjX (TVP38/TMEM64 family)